MTIFKWWYGWYQEIDQNLEREKLDSSFLQVIFIPLTDEGLLITNKDLHADYIMNKF